MRLEMFAKTQMTGSLVPIAVVEGVAYDRRFHAPEVVGVLLAPRTGRTS